MNGKKLLCTTSILYLLAGIALLGFALYMLIYSYNIDPAEDMYGEGRGWGIILGFLALVFSVPIMAFGIIGLKLYKKPATGAYYIVLGGLQLLSQVVGVVLPGPPSLFYYLIAVPPALYVIGGILKVNANKKQEHPFTQPPATTPLG